MNDTLIKTKGASMKKFFTIARKVSAVIMLTALVFTACSKGTASASLDARASTEEEGYSPGDDYEALPAGFGYPYTAIMDGHFSDFAGTWVNGRGDRIQLRSNGTLSDMERAGSASRDENNYYYWYSNPVMEEWSYRINLIPAGLEFFHYSGNVRTDTTKDRLYIEAGMIERSAVSADVYYRDGHAAAVESSGPYAKILAGNLSDFAGTWVNRRGNISELTPEGLFDNAYHASNFQKTGSGINEVYSWWISLGGDGGEVKLYPAGAEIFTWDDQIIQTDTTKVRISFYAESSDQVYYQEGEISLPVPIVLAPGTFINGYIEQGENHWYIVRSPDGGILTVETEGSTDTVLTVFSENYEYISENDDTWIGDYVDRNAKLVISVRSDTAYIFRLSAFGSGSYRILAIFEIGLG